jgi:hypothetical protein
VGASLPAKGKKARLLGTVALGKGHGRTPHEGRALVLFSSGLASCAT